MTVKKYYQNGKLASIGFDSLEEVFMYNNMNVGLVPKPSSEYEIDPNCKETVQNSEEFKDFKRRIENE